MALRQHSNAHSLVMEQNYARMATNRLILFAFLVLCCWAASGASSTLYIEKNGGSGTNLAVKGPLIINNSNSCLRIGTNVNPLAGTGERNTFIGASVADTYTVHTNGGPSGMAGQSGCDNVGIGAFVMRNLTNAFNTTGYAFGGYRNVCVGSKAGENISNGVANIFLGYSAGHTLQSGWDNVGIGDGALFTVDGTNSIGNTGVGIEAGLCITNAVYNTLYGYHAGYGNFGGGPGTLTFASPGSYNTYVGSFAGGEMRTNVAITHTKTAALGYAAGFNGGANCTYLGYYAGRYNSNDDNVVILDGFDRSGYFGEQTNALIYGRLASDIPSQRLVVNAGVVTFPYSSLGVGTTNPSQKLELVGNFKITGTHFMDGTILWNNGVKITQNDPVSFANRVYAGAGPTPQVTFGDGYVTIENALRVSGAANFTNIVTVQAGSSSSNAVVGGVLYKAVTVPAFTNLNTTIATFTNAALFINPASTLTASGDSVLVIWRGNMLAGTNNLKAIYGLQTVLDTGTFTNANSSWELGMEITRTGASTAHADAWFTFSQVAPVLTSFNDSAIRANLELAPTHSNANTNLLQLASNRAGAISNNYMRVYYEPASR